MKQPVPKVGRPLAPDQPRVLADNIQLLLSPRVPLVKMDTVIAARGEFAEAIKKHVDRGHLRWVFNVATKPRSIRDLRFWNREVSAFTATQRGELAALRSTDPAAVVNEILGDKQQFGPGEVCLLLNIRRPSLMKLRPELMGGRRQIVPRRGLERFLKRRLLS